MQCFLDVKDRAYVRNQQKLYKLPVKSNFPSGLHDPALTKKKREKTYREDVSAKRPPFVVVPHDGA